MKRPLSISSIGAAIFIALAALCGSGARAQNVGIGTTSPDNSALLDLTSISRGLLVPKMTEAQKYAIVSPASGLVIFQTTTQDTGIYAGQVPTLWFYNGGRWVPFLGGGWLLLGNSGTNAASNFIGTTDSVDWVVRTDNVEHMRVYAAGDVGLTNNNNKAEEFRFYEPSGSGSFYSGFKASSLTSVSTTYKWPSADGNGTNYILCTDGSGNLSWRGFGTAGGGGVDVFWSRGYASFALIGHGLGCTDTGNFSITDGLDNAIDDGAAASVCWGENNIVEEDDSGCVVSGGDFDTAAAAFASIGAGSNNSATAPFAAVVAGQNNSACGQYAVVVGGSGNKACGNYSSILGGTGNTVSGNYSLAFGISANVTADDNVVYYGSGVLVGIGNIGPSEAIDITGNLRFSGALMPNSLAGTAGQVLKSTGGTAPTWVAYPSSSYWSTWGNSGTAPATNYVGTSDLKDFVFKTYSTERMRILSTGQVAIDTTTTVHQLHSRYTGTTDETAGIFAQATGATTNQAVGAWGSASNTGTTNTGTIGVLATGNGSTTSGQTNAALQINDGELTMGRTTEAPGTGTAVEGAASGTAYSAQGPSGVIELTLGGGNLTTAPPKTGLFQNLGTITVNNRYCTTSSIVIVQVVSKIDDGVSPDCTQAVYFADVDNRAAGSFSLRIGMLPTATNAVTNFSTSDKIRVAYMIVNPGR